MLPNQNNKLASNSVVSQTSENKKDVPDGFHIMPDGTIMADSKHEVDLSDSASSDA